METYAKSVDKPMEDVLREQKSVLMKFHSARGVKDSKTLEKLWRTIR